MASVKVFVALKRKPSLTKQQFSDHWRHPHCTWGIGVAGVSQYVQSHRIEAPSISGLSDSFDGIVEVWFDSSEDAFGFSEDPVYRAKLQPDEPNFASMSETRVFMAAEETLMTGPGWRHGSDDSDMGWVERDRPVTVKLIQFMAPDDTQWLDEDDLEIGRDIGALRYVRCRSAYSGEAPHAFANGVRELWWPSITAFERGISTAPDAWHKIRREAEGATTILAAAERLL